MEGSCLIAASLLYLKGHKLKITDFTYITTSLFFILPVILHMFLGYIVFLYLAIGSVSLMTLILILKILTNDILITSKLVVEQKVVPGFNKLNVFLVQLCAMLSCYYIALQGFVFIAGFCSSIFLIWVSTNILKKVENA